VPTGAGDNTARISRKARRMDFTKWGENRDDANFSRLGEEASWICRPEALVCVLPEQSI
jgi:hypothetical protein